MEHALGLLSPEFHRFLDSMAGVSEGGLWYASVQTYKNRLEACVLRVGGSCLLVADAKRPGRVESSGSTDARPRFRPSGEWLIEYVRLPFIHGTRALTPIVASSDTLPGGIRSGIDYDPAIAKELSNLPAVVQDHLEFAVPSNSRLRRWQKRLGATTAAPERLWLYVTSAEQLAFAYAVRSRYDTSGLLMDGATTPWAVKVATASIGAAERDSLRLDSRNSGPPSGSGGPAITQGGF